MVGGYKGCVEDMRAMSKKLREQYLAYLADHGLEPRVVPPGKDALQEKVIDYLKAQSRASDDDYIADRLEKMYQEKGEQYRKETRHPATILIERAAESVEQSIRAIEKYQRLLKADMFAGEFPTGSINAQAVKVDGGFLVLINSGLMVVIHQVAEFLVLSDPGNASDRDINQTTIEGIIAVLEAYLRFGDPFLGPKPMSGGTNMLLQSVLSEAMQTFVVAHEYGHVIAGHFDKQVMRLEPLNTRAGPINVIQKDWQQEFEADVVAHKILLGVEDYEKLNVDIIDQAYNSTELRGSILAHAAALKAAIAAPFIFFMIDAILANVAKAASDATDIVHSDDTHPPAKERMKNLLSLLEGLKHEYSSFISFAGVLSAHFDEINMRLIRALVERSASDARAE